MVMGSSGVCGLDEMLDGSFPRNRIVLVRGGLVLGRQLCVCSLLWMDSERMSGESM